MKLSYLKNGETLVLDQGRCSGCRQCIEVCPHAVFAMDGGKSQIVDRGACMECGACARFRGDRREGRCRLRRGDHRRHAARDRGLVRVWKRCRTRQLVRIAGSGAPVRPAAPVRRAPSAPVRPAAPPRNP